MLQNPWGDFSDVKVVGNIIDSPELCIPKKNETNLADKKDNGGRFHDDANDFDFVF